MAEKKKISASFAIAFIAILAFNCSSELAGHGDFCHQDSDCESGLVCRNNICIKESSSDCDPPCPEGEVCFQGTCVLVGDPDDKDSDGHPVPDDCNDFDAQIFPGAIEYCDAIDNDCDMLTDEDCPTCSEGATQDCGTNLGECTVGVQTCIGGHWMDCSGLGPQPEFCDAWDNDCDGLTDEICPCTDGDQFPCGINQGLCTTGFQYCEGGVWTACNGRLPEPEVCDGQDNDCDGFLDEGFNLGAPCGNVGVCPAGQIECLDPGATGCSTMPGGSQDASSVETCDNLDNDCDGLTDEEAEADQAPNTCDQAQDLGEIQDNGSEILLTGNLWPDGDEDWYRIRAADDLNEETADQCDQFHFRAMFTQNPSDGMRLDVYLGDCRTVECTRDVEFEYAYDGQFPGEGDEVVGQCPCSQTNEEGKTICASEPKVFYIRVYDPNGLGSGCDVYELSVSNGL